MTGGVDSLPALVRENPAVWGMIALALLALGVFVGDALHRARCRDSRPLDRTDSTPRQ